MKRKVTKIPVFFGDFIILLDNDNWSNVNEIYSHRLNWDRPADERDEAFVFRDNYNGYSKYIVCFKSKPSNKIIAHEVVHLVNRLFEDRGIVLDVKNDECQAYLTGWFFEQIENFFKNN